MKLQTQENFYIYFSVHILKVYLSKTQIILEKQTHRASETRNISKYLKIPISTGKFKLVKLKRGKYLTVYSDS